MKGNDNLDTVQILAAENYLAAKFECKPATIKYDYKETYNYLLTTLKRFV